MISLPLRCAMAAKPEARERVSLHAWRFCFAHTQHFFTPQARARVVTQRGPQTLRSSFRSPRRFAVLEKRERASGVHLKAPRPFVSPHCTNRKHVHTLVACTHNVHSTETTLLAKSRSVAERGRTEETVVEVGSSGRT